MDPRIKELIAVGKTVRKGAAAKMDDSGRSAIESSEGPSGCTDSDGRSARD